MDIRLSDVTLTLRSLNLTWAARSLYVAASTPVTLTIVPAMIGAGAKVHVVDPQGRREGEALLPGVVWEEDAYSAASGADLVIVLTEWNEYRALDLPKLAQAMRTPQMADFRNIYDRETAMSAGFAAYEGVGR